MCMYVATADKDFVCPDGYVRNIQDLNQGAVGKHIWVCTSDKDDKGSPITGVTVVSQPYVSISPTQHDPLFCPMG